MSFDVNFCCNKGGEKNMRIRIERELFIQFASNDLDSSFTLLRQYREQRKIFPLSLSVSPSIINLQQHLNLQ
ncbi:hypothetical protein NC651_000465 [Populus alba x Populus x berolinensis]|nr:hypothetical protein NC651_000465 [Populus alba x Populus x berolinensis]